MEQHDEHMRVYLRMLRRENYNLWYDLITDHCILHHAHTLWGDE